MGNRRIAEGNVLNKELGKRSKRDWKRQQQDEIRLKIKKAKVEKTIMKNVSRSVTLLELKEWPVYLSLQASVLYSFPVILYYWNSRHLKQIQQTV